MSQSNIENTKYSLGSLIGAVILGSLISYVAFYLLNDQATSSMTSETAEKKPLYWVAPMDSNYRRDKPGQSPMGMDLVAVYADGGSDSDSGPGTIKISPEVVNNLGVRTATAIMGSLQSQISTVGYVKYDEDQLVHIHPRVEGWIEKLYVKASGDPVEKGQPLYEIYSPALVNAQEELLLAIDRKNKRLIQAAEDRLKALQIPLEVIKDIKKIRKVKPSITFYAPQSGVVDNLNIREGFFAKPGTTLMSIGKLDQVWIEAEVFERQASEVVVGLPVTMSLAYLPGKEWLGKVDYIYPTLNAKTRTIKLRLRFDNENRELKPNMFAQVLIHLNTGQETLLIPKESVIRTGNFDRVVLSLGGGRYKSVEVKTGRYGQRFVEVLSGIKNGESIVSSAQFLLDSESSKSSDFKRMNNQPMVDNKVWVEATINSLMAGHRMMNATHQPIESWDWPTMTMDFIVAESVDFSLLEKDMTLHIEIEKVSDASYEISNIHIPGIAETDMDMSSKSNQESMPSSATVNGVINSVMAGHKMLNISRDAIEKWGREAATLDFMVSDNIDFSELTDGMQVQFTFHFSDGELMITEIKPLATTNNE
jgi:membrane fusion protein, copper/silver efflux system